MCIIAGCDYLSNIHGIGIKRAHNFIQKFAKLKSKIEEVCGSIIEFNLIYWDIINPSSTIHVLCLEQPLE